MKNTVFVVRNIKYRANQVLGEGSHAKVWLAKAIFYPHNEITIKVAKDDEVAKQRIKNEIWFLKSVKHPNIPEMLEYEENAEVTWFAMPRLQNMSIVSMQDSKLIEYDISDIDIQSGYPKVASKIPLSHRQKVAMRVLVHIGKVIDYISGTNIVHADISPGNIMETRGSAIKRQYLLTDWGATMLMHKYPEENFGSLHFMAPERLTSDMGNKSDLYSLGSVAFYILTGTIPYPGKSPEEYYLNTTIYDGVHPREVDENISPHLSKVIGQLIRREPRDRPSPKDMLKKLLKIKNKI